MRAFTLALLGATTLLAITSPSSGKELKAGPLFVLCSSENNPKFVFGCKAFTEGFVEGLAGSGAICPPPDAYKEVIADLVSIPRQDIGDKRVSEVLVPRLKAKYPCTGR